MKAGFQPRLDDLYSVSINYNCRSTPPWQCEIWDGPHADYFGEGDGETMDEAIEQALLDLDLSKTSSSNR